MRKQVLSHWRMLFLIGASVAFVGQPLACHAENAGLIPCHMDAHHAGQDSHDSDGGASDGKSPGGCHLAGCHSPLSVPQFAFPSLNIHRFDRYSYPAMDQILSDPPLFEIEHPPQLS